MECGKEYTGPTFPKLHGLKCTQREGHAFSKDGHAHSRHGCQHVVEIAPGLCQLKLLSWWDPDQKADLDRREARPLAIDGG